LGVWHGRSALLLYQFLESNERLYAVDIFDLRSRSHRYFNDPNIFLGHCKRLRVDERLEVVKMDTTRDGERLAAKLGSKSCRIVHGGGGHDDRTAKMDRALGASVLVDGGVLVCDDVFLRGFPGVTQALVELLQKKGDLVPIAISTKKIWIT